MHSLVERIAAVQPRVWLFLWLFFVTLQSKVNGREAVLPLFRVGIFLLLPVAVVFGIRRFATAKFTTGEWAALGGVAYLMAYPFATMFVDVGNINVRNVKDALYTSSIYLILFYFLKRHAEEYGQRSVQALGQTWVVFALVEAVLAIAVWSGWHLDLGGARFSQQVWLDGRLHGVMGTPTHLAPVIATAALFLLTRPYRVRTTALLAFFVITLVMTGSRAALIGFLAAAPLLVLRKLGRPIYFGRAAAHGALCVSLMAGIGACFPRQTLEVMTVATRFDPRDVAETRLNIWAERLQEFSARRISTQLFGAGHRSSDGAFNVNVGYLLSFGIFYTLVFNIVYAMIVIRLLLRCLQDRRTDDLFLLMIAVFSYLFSQGNNFMFYQFVHVFQLHMLLLLMAYFERRPAAEAVRVPVEVSDRRFNPDPQLVG